MRVIEKGAPKVYKCTGRGNDNDGCGAKLEVLSSDLFQTSKTCYGDSYPEYFASFRCPECKVLTDVKHENPCKLPREKKLAKPSDPL